MKKKILYVGAFLLIAATFSSCEDLLNDCQQCRYNVYVNDVFTKSEFEAEYCGAELIAKKAAPDVTTGEGTSLVTVTKFECDN